MRCTNTALGTFLLGSVPSPAPAPKHRNVTAATLGNSPSWLHWEFPWSTGSWGPHPAEHEEPLAQPQVLPAVPSSPLQPRDRPSTRATPVTPGVTYLSRSPGRTGSRCLFSARKPTPSETPPELPPREGKTGRKGGYLLLGEPEVVGVHQLQREQSLSAPVPHGSPQQLPDPKDPTGKHPG